MGAPNGSIASVGRAMEKAIAYARKIGVIVAIAAGNDGHFGAFSDKPPVTNPDYGTVGSPGVAKDALTVAGRSMNGVSKNFYLENSISIFLYTFRY